MAGSVLWIYAVPKSRCFFAEKRKINDFVENFEENMKECYVDN